MDDPERCYQALKARDSRFDGRFYTAVLSTGIFCRPTCPARTRKFQNCSFYRSAAAAHAAGFRPCLRCRPEVAPGLAGWRGTANTVRRALDLISEGALAESGVEGLASRLGVGGRHLRRLFEEHVGTSPIEVAQAHRLLFAKKLLSETALRVSDVAHASGFSSVRRFNAAIRDVYGKTPRELRGSPASRDHRIRLKLPFKPPYDWSAMLAFLCARAIEGLEEVDADVDGGAYRRTFETGVVEVRRENDSHLLATIQLDDVRVMTSIVVRLKRLLDLDADVELIGRHLSGDGTLAPLVAKRPGLRVPGAWDGFELAVRAVVGQQITVAAARRLAGKIVERYGERLPEPVGGLSRMFPRPERLARADVASLGMPRSRARTIVTVAKAAIAEPDLFRCGSVERLQALSGIGDWTAQYIAMRALGEPDAFPLSDIGLLRALENGDGRPAPKELLARSESWRPWRAYGAQHLWTEDADV